jgi:hypothetical protein
MRLLLIIVVAVVGAAAAAGCDGGTAAMIEDPRGLELRGRRCEGRPLSRERILREVASGGREREGHGRNLVDH